MRHLFATPIRAVLLLAGVGTGCTTSHRPAASCGIPDPMRAMSASEKTASENLRLELQMDQTVFRTGEPIRARLRFRNLGPHHIVLDGLLPLRQSANPPCLAVVAPDGLRFTSDDGIPATLWTALPIEIPPHGAVLLLDADLRFLTGFVHATDHDGRPGTFRECLRKGKYQISGRFDPTPQAYSTQTATLTFELR